jgi:hypothetical protein
MFTFNKTYSGLILWSFEIPNAPYYERCAQYLHDMKLTYILLILSISIASFGQQDSSYQNDSIQVRVFNQGRHYIKSYSVTVNGHDYEFKDIWKKKYSDYVSMPYIWPNNKTEITIIVKRFFKYDEWLSLIRFPIDHVGETKKTNGEYTIFISTKVRKGELNIDDYIVKE